MSAISRITRSALALSLCVGAIVLACNDSNPQATEPVSTASGTVVSSQSGEPVPGVQVDFERCANGRGMMSDDWNHYGGMMTDADGCFHFEYARQSMHRYRVMVHGATDSQGMCYLDSGNPHEVVLRVP